MNKLQKLILIFMLISSLLSVESCSNNEDKLIRKIAYESMTSSLTEGISNKNGVVKKIETLPENATITDENYDKNSIYSVTFKNDYIEDDIVIFIDAKNNKKIGVVMIK
ncbi:hypothetical protein [Bacillus sp. OAE603]|uniref:hypothetical protein n=1 Tax=Gottfriedia sp. OAE603 TaxID=2663872 RepID=UPI0017892A38